MFEDNEKEQPEDPSENNQIIDPLKALRRVKFYKLSKEKTWDDKGTGYVSLSDTTPPKLSMANEINDEVLFDFELNDSFTYKIQHDTIIVWKSNEAELNSMEDDSAMSFQDKEGMIEICKSLSTVLGRDPVEYYSKEELSDENLFELTITNLPYIAKEIHSDLNQKSIYTLLSKFKENNCDFFKKIGVLLEEEEKKLEEIKSNCSKETNDSITLPNNNYNNSNNNDSNEANKNSTQIEHLRYIFTIYKNLFQIADMELITFLISDELYMITFGALEYDFDSQKIIKHRQYFKSVKFNNFLNLTSKEILNKIHDNLRLTYLRDTAIGRFIEETTSRIINSMIQMNNNDIMQFFLGEKRLIEEVIQKMKSDDINIKKEAVSFMIELINCSREVYQVRVTFVEFLCDCGIIQAIQNILYPIKVSSKYQLYLNTLQFKDEEDKADIIDKDKGQDANDVNCDAEDENDNDNNNEDIITINRKIHMASIEILTTILYSSSTNLKNYLITSDQHNSNSLMMILTHLLLTQDNFGLKFEISLIITTLLDSEMPDAKSPLYEILFDNCLILLSNFLSLPFDPIYKNEIVATKQVIIEIFSHCTTIHSSHLQYWFTHNNIFAKVLHVFNDRQKVLHLAVIRLIKTMIKHNDYNFNKVIINSECFDHIIALFDSSKAKDNLLFASIMDLFVYMSINCRKVLEQLFMNYNDFFYSKSNRSYFKEIISRYENPKEGDNNDNSNKISIADLQYPGLYSREMNEKEDEDFFNSNDDNDNENDFGENFLLGKKTQHPSDRLDDDIKLKERELFDLLNKRKGTEEEDNYDEID